MGKITDISEFSTKPVLLTKVRSWWRECEVTVAFGRPKCTKCVLLISVWTHFILSWGRGWQDEKEGQILSGSSIFTFGDWLVPAGNFTLF